MSALSPPFERLNRAWNRHFHYMNELDALNYNIFVAFKNGKGKKQTPHTQTDTHNHTNTRTAKRQHAKKTTCDAIRILWEECGIFGMFLWNLKKTM